MLPCNVPVVKTYKIWCSNSAINQESNGEFSKTPTNFKTPENSETAKIASGLSRLYWISANLNTSAYCFKNV